MHETRAGTADTTVQLCPEPRSIITSVHLRLKIKEIITVINTPKPATSFPLKMLEYSSDGTLLHLLGQGSLSLGLPG